MTVDSRTPRLVFATIDAAIDGLRAQGMRVSTPRRFVLEALFAAEGPVSAEHLTRTLRLDLTSVYRNLEMLERHGLVRHVHLGHGPGLYALARGEETEYLYCDRCAKVTPVTPEQLDPIRDQLKDTLGYHVHFTHFAMIGLCAQCAKRPDRDADRGGGENGGADLDTPTRDSSSDQVHRADDPTEHLHSHGDHIHSHSHSHSHPHTNQTDNHDQHQP